MSATEPSTRSTSPVAEASRAGDVNRCRSEEFSQSSTADSNEPPGLLSRGFFQFSLRSLLLLTLLLSGALAWFGSPQAPPPPPGEWNPKTGKNIRWRVTLGRGIYSRPVIHGDQIFIGGDNSQAFLPRLNAKTDLATMLCFRCRDGRFLWQASHPRLPGGRMEDWPSIGLMGSVTVEANRLWYVNNRAEVVCLDTEGFRDNQNDGLYTRENPRYLNEADIVWKRDLRADFGVQPAMVCNTTPLIVGHRLYVATCHGNDGMGGFDPRPPSFLCLDKASGRVLWSDNSPGSKVLPKCTWNSPSYGVFDGVPQVLFPGRDGWLYSFAPEGGPGGKSRLLWKFDGNPKRARYLPSGRGDRHALLGRPAIADGRVYIAMGLSPEEGDFPSVLYCLDPTRRGDVSPERLIRGAATPPGYLSKQYREFHPDGGDRVVKNPNSALLWEFRGEDINRNGKREFEEELHRVCNSLAVGGSLVVAVDFAGIVHCLDAETGRQHWSYDLQAAAWASPLISGDRLFVGDEDGVVHVFRLSADPTVALRRGEPWLQIPHDGPIYSTPVVDRGVLYLAAGADFYAIADDGGP